MYARKLQTLQLDMAEFACLSTILLFTQGNIWFTWTIFWKRLEFSSLVRFEDGNLIFEIRISMFESWFLRVEMRAKSFAFSYFWGWNFDAWDCSFYDGTFIFGIEVLMIELLFLRLELWCWNFDFWDWSFDVGTLIFGIEALMLELWFLELKLWCWNFDFWNRSFDDGTLIFGIGALMLELGRFLEFEF